MSGVLDPYQAQRTRQQTTGPIDPYSTDETPQVTVTLNGQESDLITQYCYDSDITQLGDPFSVILPDPHNRYAGVLEGQSIKLTMASPRVGNGQKITKITGIVTQVIRDADRERGTILNIAGADLGHHLVHNDAPIWKRLPGQTFGGLFKLLVDPSWNFAGFRAGNDQNARVKMGGSYARSTATLGDKDKPPIVQIEPGDKPADIFIQYAKLVGKLVNVSSDGYLQLFKPNYGPPPGTAQVAAGTFGTSSPIAYRFFHYAEKDRANKNNVIRARLTRALEGRFTKAVCVGTRMIPQSQGVDPNDPNANSFRGTFAVPATGLVGSSSVFPALGFNRLKAFADPDRLNRTQAQARAQWALNRALYDAWIYEVTVKGHSQGGNFYEPDTMAEVNDTVLGVSGQLYVGHVRYDRTRDDGTTTTVEMHQPFTLAA